MEIKVEGCTFNDNASVVRNCYGNIYIEDVRSDIERAKSRTYDEKLLQALERLETAVERNSENSIRSVIRDFATQFTSNLFANIAGAALKGLIGLFLA